MTTTPAEVLRRAEARIARGGWVQKNIAEEPDGTPCSSFAPNALRFCALGAIFRECERVYPDVRDVRHRDLLQFYVTSALYREAIGDPSSPTRHSTALFSLSEWNDTKGRTAQEVRQALLNAAETLESG